MHTGPLIPTHYIAQISDHMDERGLDSDAWLTASHLRKDLLHQPGLKIDYQQFKQLILTAVQGCDQADIGIIIGKKLSIWPLLCYTCRFLVIQTLPGCRA